MLDADRLTQPSRRSSALSTRLTRRQLLLGFVGSMFGLSALAACRSGKPTATASGQPAGTAHASSSSSSPTASSDQGARNASTVVVQHVVSAEVALIAAYDAAATAHPGLVPLIGALRAHHVEHLHAVDPTAPTPSPTAPTGPTAPTAAAPASSPLSGSAPAGSAPSSSAPTGSTASPPTATETLATLASLERAAAAARLDDMARSTGSLARLIASIGGCEASHVVALGAA
jgi:hypothetical protein